MILIQVYVMMGLVYSSTPSSPIISLREAFMMPPDLTIYKSEIEDHVIDVSYFLCQLLTLYCSTSYVYIWNLFHIDFLLKRKLIHG